MRNVTATNTLSDVRTINANLKFTDKRLRFAYGTLSESITNIYGYDADNYGTGILRIATVQTPGDTQATIYFQNITNPTGTWQAWTALSFKAKLNSKPGLFGGRMFYQDLSGKVYYADFNGTTFLYVGVLNNSVLTGNVSIAPVSTTVAYICSQLTNTTNSNTSKWITRDEIGAGSKVMHNIIFSTNADTNIVDAVSINGIEYFYGSEEGGNRGIYMKYRVGGSYSELSPIVPIDVVDDTSMFQFSAASIINNLVFVTGINKRTYGAPYHIYTIGPEKFTMGRDAFIRPENTTLGGKLHLVGGTLYYIGPNLLFTAPATEFVGYVDPNLTATTSGIIEANITCESNNPFSGTFQIPNSLSGSPIPRSALRGGSEAVLTTTVNGDVAQIGKFSVDSINRQSNENSVDFTITARSDAVKKLAQWECGSSFDYWSQSKQSCVPGDLTQLIRQDGTWVNGDWTGGSFVSSGSTMIGGSISGSAVYLDDLNEAHTMYSSMKSSRNFTVRARFRKTPINFGSQLFGVGSAWYKETQQDAATRLGIDVTAVTSDQMLEQGVFAMIESNPSGTSQYIKYGLNGVALGTSSPVTLLDNTDYWIELTLFDGNYNIYLRPDSSPNWSLIGSGDIDDSVNSLWYQNYEGKAVAQVESKTIRSASYAFDEADVYVPVVSTADFPTSETIRVDGEIMQYGAKTANISAPGKVIVMGVKAFAGADPTSYQPFGDVRSRNYIVQQLSDASNIVSGNNGFSLWVKKIGSPSDKLAIRFETINSAHYFPGGGTQLYETEIASEDISPNGTKLYIWFDSGLTLTSNTWLSLTRSYSANQPDPNNYYAVGVTSNTGCYLKTWDDDADAFTTLNANMSLTVFNGLVPDGYYHIGISDGSLSQVNDYYKGCAMVVTSGSQVDTVFQILGSTTNISVNSGAPLSGYTSFRIDKSPNDLEEGTMVDIVPTLYNLTRTDPLSHVASNCDIYRASPHITYDRFEAFSSEYDFSAEDMITELARKAGVLDIQGDDLYNRTVVPSANIGYICRRNVITKLTIPTNFSGTISVSARHTSPGDFNSGVRVVLSPTTLSYITGTTTREVFPLSCLPTGEITVSIWNNFMSVWQDGRFIHAFVMTDADAALTGSWYTISGTCTLTIPVHVPGANIRVDNYILDMGQKGTSLLSTLIGEKRIWFQDNNTGGLRIITQRPDVNPNSPYTRHYSMSDIEYDASCTHVRVEGAELMEAIDTNMIVEFGDLFTDQNMFEINNLDEANYFSGVLLDEAGSSNYGKNFIGAADTRLEPNDMYYVLENGKTTKMIVDNVVYSLSATQDTALFDMTVNGRIPRSAL